MVEAKKKKAASKKGASSSAKGKKKAGKVDLPEVLTIVQAADFHKQLSAHVGKVKGAGILRLNAKAVERITSPCVQVLLAAEKALVERGCGLAIDSPSDALVDAFDDLGLDDKVKNWSGE